MTDMTGRLRRLQRTVRDATGAQAAAVRATYQDTLAHLRADVRYADIDDLDALLTDFCDACRSGRSTDQVPGLLEGLEQRAAQVETRTILLALEGLKVTEPVALGQVEFVSPAAWPGQLPPLEESVGALARLSVRGSIPVRMAERARAATEDALAKLRVTAAAQGADDVQLRFHLTGRWAVAEGDRLGWWRPAQQNISLEVGPWLLGPERAHPVTRLPFPLENDAQRQAEFALKWLNQAMLAEDPLLRSVLPVFALEALLGDRSARLKARNLVFYRIMLGATVSGWWTSPVALHTFYERIRSYAVHGSVPPRQVSERDIDFLHIDARDALKQYLTLCEREGISKRSRMLRWLNDHELAPQPESTD
jgi:hypothetical protein